MALMILLITLLIFQTWLTWYITELIFGKKTKRKPRFKCQRRQPSGNVKIISKI